MLKLKYLFDNADLAEMILRNWEFDEQSLEMFKYYRISSNAVYPFRFQDQVRLLRFAPKMEKNKDHIAAELEFIAYLRTNGYGAMESVVSMNGEELAEVRTPWGEYYASVFKRVTGVQINATDFGDNVIFSHGKALGKLHSLSSVYRPEGRTRESHDDVLDGIRKTLLEFPAETAALEETRLLHDYFASIPRTKSNYGLIHYDFEYDNVFYDEQSNSCNVIDFDDSMYHWYAMDIEQALDSLRDYIPNEIFNRKKRIFMDGYETEYELSEEMASILPACRRFANLYGYVRVLRAMEEQWANEPEWLVKLRGKLTASMKEDSSVFGMKM
jgi:Ser/Thr protein kinase RdoA (MazF antagonist)